MYSLAAAASCAEALAFEPVPLNAYKIMASARRNNFTGWLHVYTIGASDSFDLFDMGLSEANQGEATHTPAAERGGGGGGGSGGGSGSSDGGVSLKHGLLTSTRARRILLRSSLSGTFVLYCRHAILPSSSKVGGRRSSVVDRPGFVRPETGRGVYFARSTNVGRERRERRRERRRGERRGRGPRVMPSPVHRRRGSNIHHASAVGPGPGPGHIEVSVGVG